MIPQFAEKSNLSEKNLSGIGRFLLVFRLDLFALPVNAARFFAEYVIKPPAECRQNDHRIADQAQFLRNLIEKKVPEKGGEQHLCVIEHGNFFGGGLAVGGGDEVLSARGGDAGKQ